VRAFKGWAENPLSAAPTCRGGAKQGLTAEFCETQNHHHIRTAQSAGTEQRVVNPTPSASSLLFLKCYTP
jgi:hypothetical protein